MNDLCVCCGKREAKSGCWYCADCELKYTGPTRKRSFWDNVKSKLTLTTKKEN